MEYIESLRLKVGKDKVLIPSTAIVILNNKNEVLLHLREGSNTWGLPGGLMDLGETVSESAEREVFEETGLKVNDLNIFGVFSGPKFEVTYPDGNQTSSVAIGFFTSKYSGNITKSSESREINFFSIMNLPENINHAQTGFLNGFKRFLEDDKRSPISS